MQLLNLTDLAFVVDYYSQTPTKQGVEVVDCDRRRTSLYLSSRLSHINCIEQCLKLGNELGLAQSAQIECFHSSFQDSPLHDELSADAHAQNLNYLDR